jgi:hypothetical protein
MAVSTPGGAMCRLSGCLKGLSGYQVVRLSSYQGPRRCTCRRNVIDGLLSLNRVAADVSSAVEGVRPRRPRSPSQSAGEFSYADSAGQDARLYGRPEARRYDRSQVHGPNARPQVVEALDEPHHEKAQEDTKTRKRTPLPDPLPF